MTNLTTSTPRKTRLHVTCLSEPRGQTIFICDDGAQVAGFIWLSAAALGSLLNRSEVEIQFTIEQA